MSIRHVSDHRSEPLEQQPKNGPALAQGPAQAVGVVMEDGAGGAALEAAPRTVIEFVGRDLGGQPKLGVTILPLPQAKDFPRSGSSGNRNLHRCQTCGLCDRFPFVPAGTLLIGLNHGPSHKWPGYFRGGAAAPPYRD